MTSDDDDLKMGWLRDDPLWVLARTRLSSRGASGGPGGGGRTQNIGRGSDGHPTRAAHIRVRPVRSGSLPNYVDRGDDERKREDLKRGDLESRGGLPAGEMERRIRQLEERIAADQTIARDARGRQPAPAYEITFDLPLESTLETRKRTVERIAAEWESSGHVATWAIHFKKGHPHAHLVLLAGQRGERPIDGSAAMKAQRNSIATTVNSTHIEMTGERLPVEFSGKTLRELGVARPPRPDIPTGLYRARQRRQEGSRLSPNSRLLAAAADRIEAAWMTDVEAQAAGLPIPSHDRRRRIEMNRLRRLRRAPAAEPPLTAGQPGAQTKERTMTTDTNPHISEPATNSIGPSTIARKPAADGADGEPSRALVSPAPEDLRRAQQLARQVGLALDPSIELDSERLAVWFADAKRQKVIRESLMGTPFPSIADEEPAAPDTPVKPEVIRIKLDGDGRPDGDDVKLFAAKLRAMSAEALVAAWSATQAARQAQERRPLRDAADVAQRKSLLFGTNAIAIVAKERGVELPKPPRKGKPKDENER